jgi:hypothetical protein
MSRTALRWDGRPSRSAGGWSSKDQSIRSARSPSTGTSTAPVAGGQACHGCSPSASRSAAGDGATAGVSRRSQIARPSISGQPKPICAARLGGRSDPLPPPARHSPDAAGKALPADPGPASSQQGGRSYCRRHRRRTGQAPRQRATHHHSRQRRRVPETPSRQRRSRPAHLFLRSAQSMAARVDREHQRPHPARPSPQDQPRGIHRCRHRRRNLEPQFNAAKMPRLPNPDRGFRRQPRCRT